MRHVMIDLETLDTEITTHVLSIGACVFDPVIRELGPTFYGICDGHQPGRTISRDTVSWWMDQPPATRREVFWDPRVGNPRAVPLPQALIDLDGWCSTNMEKPGFFWANDPDFDIAILKDAWRAFGDTKSWFVPYNAGRSLRTIAHAAWGEAKGMWPIRPTDYVAHTAVGDARYQALVVIAAWKDLGRTRIAGPTTAGIQNSQ